MKKAKILSISVHFLIVIAALLVWNCSEEDGSDEGYGNIRVVVTDAPFSIDMIEEANVTISKIEIRSKDSIGESPFIIIFEDSVQLNLMDLRNGIVKELVNAPIPAGNYDLIRIYIADSNVKLINGSAYDLKIPSGAQSGLKMFVNPEISVRGGLTTELLLDFELNKSFVAKGNHENIDDVKGFNFKPVIRAVNNAFAGRVEGYIKDSAELAVPMVNVFLRKDTVVSSTLSDSSGFFALIGIPEGTFELVCEKEGFQMIVIEDVEISAANKTDINLQLTKSQE